MANQSDIRYHWTRRSKILLAFFTLYELAVLLWGIFYGVEVAFWFFLVGGLLPIGLFYNVQVTVYKDSLYMSWGIALFTREVGFGEMADFKILKNKILSAYIYNPNGEHVLEVRLRSGKKIYIPCDKAKKLMEILKVPL